MAPKRPRDEGDPGEQHVQSSGGVGERGDVRAVFESAPIKDRQSTFIAAFTPYTTITPKLLQARAEYASASHRILAWRKPSKQQRLNTSSNTSNTNNAGSGSGTGNILHETGSDDDGEKYAGKKLEKVLAEMDVVGVVVVARWYGGVLLGPVRFAHIEGVARDAIGKWRAGEGGGGKRVKVDAGAAGTGSGDGVNGGGKDGIDVDPEEEQRQKEALAKQLENRDSNIVVLRGLLAEKQAAKSSSQDDSSQKGTGRAAPPLDYSRMPLPALKKLEKARDATIAWILKQLDEVEAEREIAAT